MIYLIIQTDYSNPQRGCVSWHSPHKNREDAYAAFGQLDMAPNDYAELVEIDSITPTWRPLLQKFGPKAVQKSLDKFGFMQ